MGLPHPVTSKLDAHNCWLVSPRRTSRTRLTRKADVVKDYIDWAASQGYAVIDVNIPKNVKAEPVYLPLSNRYCSR